MENKVVIISRHPAAIQFMKNYLQEEFDCFYEVIMMGQENHDKSPKGDL